MDDKVKENKDKILEQPAETHQQADEQHALLTTAQGVPVSDNQNSLRVTPKGPTLLEDFHLREKIFHFDHERIPERVVHARGFGAHGYFENYACLKQYTCADLFQRENEKTPVFVRFSTVAGSKGSADLARDVRGFAVKLYTKQGVWDLVGNNMPVFFIQDAVKFPDLIHAAKEEPNSGFPQAQTAHDNFWDFISLTPESMHMVMWIMSDRAIPRAFRFMEGFGVHTFRFINAEKKSTFVKFHWKPNLGLQSVLWNEAVSLNGADPDFHRRDLWNAIQAGHYPEWELGLQLFDEQQAATFDFDVLDATKLIPEELVPIKKVGRLVLNRCVDNFFAETEQVAFCTQNIVPGIDFSNDPLLQGRNFSYLDTQLKRLGSPNFAQLPINAPKCPLHMFHQDGHMAFSNISGRANYEPNSWGKQGGPRESHEQGFTSYPEHEEGIKQRLRPTSFADHYSQATLFYQSQTEIEQQHICEALIFELSKVVTPRIRIKMIAHLLNIDNQLAKCVAKGLGIKELPAAAELFTPKKSFPVSSALSIIKSGKKSFAGRKLGIVIDEQVNTSLLMDWLHLLKKENVTYEIITSSVNGVKIGDEQLFAQQNFDTANAAFYDAMVFLLHEFQGLSALHKIKLQRLMQDAFYQYKFIAYSAAAAELGKPLHLPFDTDAGMLELTQNKGCEAFLSLCKNLRHWSRQII